MTTEPDPDRPAPAPELTLTGREKKELRGAAQRLKPAVSVGRQGLTAACVAEVEAALARHGLIKVRFGASDREARKILAADLASRTSSACVGAVGSVAIFYRPDHRGSRSR